MRDKIHMKSRSSNIELLRIVAMLMIVLHHVITHGIGDDAGKDAVVIQYLDCFFIFGVNLFVLISGYFGIRLTWRSFLNLMWIIAFYKLFHLAADTFVLGISHPWYEWIAKPLLGFVSGGGWFVDVYVLLMIVSPMLNKLLQALDKHGYILALATLLVLDSGYGYTLGMHFDRYGYGLLHFITLYFIGHGIKNYFPLSQFAAFKVGGGFIVIMLLYLFMAFISKKGLLAVPLYSYSNPLVIISSACIFVLFTKMNIHSSKAINFMAASMFPVYLIHDAGKVGRMYYSQINTWWNTLPFYLFAFYTAILIIILFVFTLSFDQLRKQIWKRLVLIYENSIYRKHIHA